MSDPKYPPGSPSQADPKSQPNSPSPAPQSPSDSPSTDRFEKSVHLKAPLSRVWRAISDSEQFGLCFGMKLDGPFVAGAWLKGVMTGTTVDAQVREKQKPHEGSAFELYIERIEPEHHFSFRWHPYEVDPKVDSRAQPTTLITFTLEEQNGGVLLTIAESGFDQIPAHLRAQAFQGNAQGWEIQCTLIEKFLLRGA